MRARARAVANHASPEVMQRATTIVRWAFYIFVASFAFEYPDRTIPVETTTLTGAVFLLMSFLQPHVCYRRPPTAFWLFAAYLNALGIAYIVNGGEHSAEALKSLILRVQVTMLFLASYNLLRDREIARRALVTLGLACSVIAVLTLLGVADVLTDDGGARATVLGQNANRAAKVLGAGMLAMLGLSLSGARPRLGPRPLIWLLAGLIGAAIIHGGSRGGLLALAAGLWTLTIAGGTVTSKIRSAILSFAAIVLLLWAAFSTPLMRERIERARGGDLAGREEIFPASWELFLDQPLIGWGPTENSYELAARIDDGEHIRRDTHNIVLEVLTTTGLAGTIPFFAAVAMCFLASWRSRDGPLGIVPFAMMVAILAGNMSGNYIALKLTWFVMALGLASGRLADIVDRAVPARLRRRAIREWRAVPTAH